MTSKVYFTPDLKAAGKLFDKLDIKFITENSFAAVKMHFGEVGNTAYLKPKAIKPVIEKIARTKANAFLTDANTLYKGTRSDAVSHLKTAGEHGFSLGALGLPLIIADGLNGKDYVNVKVDLKHFKEVKIASTAYNADSIVVLTHFKGHELTGFGGALKNVGMGLGARSGKQLMHADVRPAVDPGKCVACGKCIEWCPVTAIKYVKGKADIDQKTCIGCGECIASCNYGAIAKSWAGSSDSVQEKMVEYFYGVWKDKKGKMAFINYLTDISPNCDCYGWNDKPVTADIGVLASYDPVAIDQASIDLVNKAADTDVFRRLYPDVKWETQLRYAEELGIGKRSYELTKI